MNELLLIGSLVFAFAAVLTAWRLFGKTGLYAMTVLCTITANIEVMILVHAFGMDQTLGNVLFAASFLVTDILSENEGKKAAGRAVNIGIFTSVIFILISQSWMVYNAAENGGVTEAIRMTFKGTPRVMLVSIVVYAVTQRFDVWLYHKIWERTSRFSNGKNGSKAYLWLRNNGSTLTSQFLNTFLFTLGTFFGVYDTKVLISILVSSYLIFIVTSLCDTPAVYVARRIKEKGRVPD